MSSSRTAADKCWRCGTTVGSGNRHCGECGALLSAQGENPPSPAALSPPPASPAALSVPSASPPAVRFLEPEPWGAAPTGQGPGHHVQNVTVAAPAPSAPPQHNINVYVQHGSGTQESSTFAIVTLVAYFACSPVGMLLNLIGLLTGPKRGCFLAMFLVLFLPTAAAFVLLAVAFAIGLADPNGQGLEQFLNDPEAFFNDLENM